MSDDAIVETMIPGIAHPLPPGERVLWTGAPSVSRMARDAMHVRGLAVYFLVLLLAPALFAAPGASPLAAVVTAAVWVVPLGVSTVLFARALGALAARTTVYAITDRRVVMKVGIALPMTFNIPLHTIAAADVRVRDDGTGDVAITLGGDVRIAYLLLWPHARPWHFARPHPLLRGVDRAAEVARVLGDAIRADATRADVVPAAVVAPANPMPGARVGLDAPVAVRGLARDGRMPVGVGS